MSNNSKVYEADGELLYMISENNEEASNTLIKKYEPVIEYYVKKYITLVEGKGLDYNDLYQEGLIGLNGAIINYKDQKNIKFSTFAFLCIKRKMFTAIKNANRKKHSILNESYSLDYKLNEDENLNFENFIYSSDGGIEDLLVSNEDSKFFSDKINSDLTFFEKQVYEMKINGFSNEEISQTLDKTQKSIESVLFRIRIKIKKILNEINVNNF